MLLKDFEHFRHSFIFLQKGPPKKNWAFISLHKLLGPWPGRVKSYVPTLIESAFAWRILMNVFYICAPDGFTPTA
jgi:hypothetical protein